MPRTKLTTPWAVGAALATAAVGAAHPPAVHGQEAAPPDLSGVWQRNFPGMSSLIPDPPMTEWGRERFDAAKPIHGPRTTSATEANAAELMCLPMGFPATYYRPRPFEIIQLPDRAVMLFEVDHFWRIIHMDGREFPEIPLHTWNGYSIGHYEGDTLVIRDAPPDRLGVGEPAALDRPHRASLQRRTAADRTHPARGRGYAGKRSDHRRSRRLRAPVHRHPDVQAQGVRTLRVHLQ